MNRIAITLAFAALIAGCADASVDPGTVECFGEACAKPDADTTGGGEVVPPDTTPDVGDTGDDSDDPDVLETDDGAEVDDINDADTAVEDVDIDVPDEGDDGDTPDVPETNDGAEVDDTEDTDETTDTDETDTPVDPCDGVDCTDDNPCTIDETCVDGECVSSPVVCNDDNPCTDDACVVIEGGCVYTPNAVLCEDGDPCTLEDACVDGSCAPGAPKICQDANFCTVDACDPVSGECAFVVVPEPCDDGNECTQEEVCQQDATCGNGAEVECADEDPCTNDSCNPDSGCVFAQKECDDEDPCTVDLCETESGECTFVIVPECKCAPEQCTDDNPCTSDVCNPLDGSCSFPFNTEPCDDGDPCTLEDACADGSCAPGAPKSCISENICLSASCNPETGSCELSENTAPCDDGDACTQEDVCNEGSCAGVLMVCTDDNPCTEGDTCNGGTCAAGEAKVCEDGNPCTVGACDPDSGECAFSPDNGGSCTDDNPCTNDVCQDGECVSEANSACCTEDAQCADELACTQDQCVEQLCKNFVIPGTGHCLIEEVCIPEGVVNSANDCEACTSMVNPNGWSPLVDGSDCEDGQACTEGDTCNGGTCAAGEAKVCEDGNPCTVGACDPDSGECAFSPDNGGSCTDDNPCTNDVCQDGECVSTTVACDDGLPCTLDSCDEAGECQYEPKTCDDSNPCTIDSCEQSTGDCVGELATVKFQDITAAKCLTLPPFMPWFAFDDFDDSESPNSNIWHCGHDCLNIDAACQSQVGTIRPGFTHNGDQHTFTIDPQAAFPELDGMTISAAFTFRRQGVTPNDLTPPEVVVKQTIDGIETVLASQFLGKSPNNNFDFLVEFLVGDGLVTVYYTPNDFIPDSERTLHIMLDSNIELQPVCP